MTINLYDDGEPLPTWTGTLAAFEENNPDLLEPSDLADLAAGKRVQLCGGATAMMWMERDSTANTRRR